MALRLALLVARGRARLLSSPAASFSSSSSFFSSSASASAAPPVPAATGAPSSSSSSSATQQPVQFSGADVTPELLAKSAATDARMRRDYDAMPTRFAPHTQPGGGAPEVGAAEAFRKRLLYRSKQRGWLEVDLLLGTWAERHLAALPEAALRDYERILNRETLDVYNFITGKEPAPAELEGPVLASIKRFVAEGGSRFVGPEGYAAIKGGMSN